MDMDMHEINERLKDILASEGHTTKDYDVACALGIAPNTYAQMKFRNAIPFQEIMDFLAKKGISINLFFYNQELRKDTDQYKMLKLLNTKASLGYGAWGDEEGELVILDRRLAEYFSQDADDIIHASGDSMEPYIIDSDLCVIAKNQLWNNGDICVVSTPSGLMIKRVYKNDEKLIFVSNNPLYAPIIYYLCECEVVGKVMGVIRSI